MRPSRVTLEQAQELFKTCMPVRKKRRKAVGRLSWTDSGKAGICGSDTAAVSKICNGWIRIERPRYMQGGYTASGYIRSYRVRVCRTGDGIHAKSHIRQSGS